jgi:hypothetical protein
VLSRVLYLRILPPGTGGFQRCQVSYGSGSHLLIEMDSGTTTYPAVPCWPRASRIKKSLAVLTVQLGMHVPNARKFPRRLTGPARRTGMQRSQYQGVQTGIYSAAIVRLQCDVNTMDHSPSTATVPSGSIARCHTANRVQRDK